MKKKVLFSIVAVALFAVAMAFNSQNNNTTRQLNIKALKDANANATCQFCNPADGVWCYIDGHTEEDFCCGAIWDDGKLHVLEY